jgi:uncharacterized membrane protein YhhN
MKKRLWLIFFVFVLAADLLAIQMNLELMKILFKPLIILSLLGYFISALDVDNSSLKPLIIIALLFSWLGDVLLIFEPENSLFFILGLSAFLIAHLFYIYFFHQLRVMNALPGKVLLLVPVVVYYIILMYILGPNLGPFQLPVRIYGVVISFMLMLSLHMLYIKKTNAGKLFALGAFLFVISDSLLAINKFYSSFQFAGFLIILAYGLAQYCIIKGAVIYLNAEGSK